MKQRNHKTNDLKHIIKFKTHSEKRKIKIKQRRHSITNP